MVVLDKRIKSVNGIQRKDRLRGQSLVNLASKASIFLWKVLHFLTNFYMLTTLTTPSCLKVNFQRWRTRDRSRPRDLGPIFQSSVLESNASVSSLVLCSILVCVEAWTRPQAICKMRTFFAFAFMLRAYFIYILTFSRKLVRLGLHTAPCCLLNCCCTSMVVIVPIGFLYKGILIIPRLDVLSSYSGA